MLQSKHEHFLNAYLSNIILLKLKKYKIWLISILNLVDDPPQAGQIQEKQEKNDDDNENSSGTS